MKKDKIKIKIKTEVKIKYKNFILHNYKINKQKKK
jgi:hypothetical protein